MWRLGDDLSCVPEDVYSTTRLTGRSDDLTIHDIALEGLIFIDLIIGVNYLQFRCGAYLLL